MCQSYMMGTRVVKNDSGRIPPEGREMVYRWRCGGQTFSCRSVAWDRAKRTATQWAAVWQIGLHHDLVCTDIEA